MNEEDIRSIALSHELNDDDTELLVKFITLRFPTEQCNHYVGEWATRIKEGKHLRYADVESTAIFKSFL